MERERDQELVNFFSSYLSGLCLGLDALSAAGMQIYQADTGLWFWRWGRDQSEWGLTGLGVCIEDAVMMRFGMSAVDDSMAIDCCDENLT